MKSIFRRAFVWGFVVLAAIGSLFAEEAAQKPAEEKVGVRPYEMDWAGRTEEVRTPLIDFETLGDWTLQTENSFASFSQSREEQMYGEYVGKLVYRMADEKAGAPVVTIRLEKPLPLPEKFDAVSLWIEGNNWAWHSDPKTPQVLVSLLFQRADGSDYAVPLERVRWNEWFLVYHHLNETQLADLNQPGTVFAGLRVEGGWNQEDRVIYFDSLCIFEEEFAPLEFSQRPKRNVELFPGQDAGQNTGEGTLPFPTRPETVEPSNLTADFTNRVEAADDKVSWRFIYEGSDGKLVYQYTPKTGDWSDFTARWNDGAEFLPLAGGGIVALCGDDGQTVPVTSFTQQETRLDGETLIARWNLSNDKASASVEYRFSIRGKNLICDTLCAGGNVAKVGCGRVEKITDAKNVLIPYYSYGYTVRPAALVFRAGENTPTLFALMNIDWYRSNASYLRGLYEAKSDYGVTSGGAEYNQKTDKTRNDVFERFVFSVSPRFEEVLPNIANPVSPWKSVTGKGVWRSHGASTRDGDKKYWYNVWRHGMRHMIITDHEVCWRDGGESFTFRTRPAPKKGGDEGWIDYSNYMQNTLGFVYGPYNNFTDFAPVNEYWSPDMVSRSSNNDLQQAWARCYAPKPTRAVEYCEKLSPINEAKFHFSTAYCDVHSSVTPWSRTDYDPRTPGAGTFAAVYYAYGEIFLLQKAAWDGPVYSEGPHHCFFSGLTDGNYAQDQAYRFMSRPWLVDFDLLKMHPLECDFGMGNTGMFAPGFAPKSPEERSEFLDRFLAATLCFGHPGFYAADTLGIQGSLRSYYMIQQIATRYTQADVDEIRYVDDAGSLHETSDAIASDIFADNRLVVRYKDGTVVMVNGSPQKTMRVTVDGREISLPPNGYEAWTADGKIYVASKLDESGSRFDYCDSPEYIYFDGRGAARKTDKAFGTGQSICRILEDGTFEIIPIDQARVGFAIDADKAVALDFDNKEIGEARLNFSNGCVFVEPVEGAFSYRLEKSTGADTSAGIALISDRIALVPGETARVVDKNDSAKTYDVTVPADAVPGTLFTAEPVSGGKIDFVVCPLCTVDISPIQDGVLTFSFYCHRAGTEKILAAVKIAGEETSNEISLENGRGEFVYRLPELAEGETTLTLTLTADGLTQKVEKNVQTVLDYPLIPFDFVDKPDSLAAMPQVTVEIRNQAPTLELEGTGAYLYKEASLCCNGVVKNGFATHPPYMKGPGCIWFDYEIALPAENVVFTAAVGKRDGSDAGDGIWYSARVVNPDGSQTTIGETTVKTFGWGTLEADLSAYAGKKVILRLVTDCGPDNNTAADWAAWSELALRAKEKKLLSVIEQ